MQEIEKLRKEGMKDSDIAKGFGMSLSDLRAHKSIAVNEIRQHNINQAQRLQDKGYSKSAIGRRMGTNESTVRSWLAPGAKDKVDVLHSTANLLKSEVDKKEYLDVGAGTHHYIGVSKDKLKGAITLLKAKFGYTEHEVHFPQVGARSQYTTTRVLAKPGVDTATVRANRNKIKTIQGFSKDKGRSYLGIHEPLAISPRRVAVRWAEDGGDKKDGVIYVREGVKDVDLGGTRYAQVRIQIGDGHYLKGMAIYSKDIPDGADLVFHTNKPKGPNKLSAMKPLKDDPDNPFGAVVRQITTTDPATGKEIVTSAMNKVGLREGQYEEGGWNEWSRVLPSQMLSKQRPALAKQQLDMTHERAVSEFNKIQQLTNPAVKKKLLETFADETDKAAVHLKAANMPRQANKVLMPIPQMKDNEVYTTSFNNGDSVALVRFPHAGPFEIPILTVNNKVPAAKALLGKGEDVIGINHRVAHQLSGADFDGDAVLVIPNNRGAVKSQRPLKDLEGFDPIRSFPPYDGMKTIDGGRYNAKSGQVEYGKKGKSDYMQNQMGQISNLITDMTIKGAGPDDLARAVKHSMVIIDSEKHALDYKASYEQNGIRKLKERYQAKDDPSKPPGGASTLLSRATAEKRIADRKPRPAGQGGPIDPATGKKVFVDTGRRRLVPHERLALTDDAHTLVGPGTQMEKLYADHSNRLKALANQARKETLSIKPSKVNESAKKTYAPQVESLLRNLAIAEKNAPLERQAHRLADAVVAQKKRAHPEMSDDDLKKIERQALNEARNRTGAKKLKIVITEEEWRAIQAGAITSTKLTDILKHADLEVVKEHATPRTKRLMNTARTARAKQMLEMGYTQAEVAAQLGVSITTLKDSLAGG
jgi:transposase